MDLVRLQGLHTVESFAQAANLKKSSALNLLVKLKKQGFVTSSGGAHQKRLYRVTATIQRPTNGFYDIVNRYSPEKLIPSFKHYVYGDYTVENALLQGLKLGTARSKEASLYLFNHISNWKKLFSLAKKEGLTSQLLELYQQAKSVTKVKRIPRRYMK